MITKQGDSAGKNQGRPTVQPHAIVGMGSSEVAQRLSA